jgi:hypothetical protein
MMRGSMRLLSMMSVDIMMSLIFRCRHHDESEHNDGRVSPLVNKGEPHFANIHNWADVIARACFGSNYSEGKEIFSKLGALQMHLSKNFFKIGIPGMRFDPFLPKFLLLLWMDRTEEQ